MATNSVPHDSREHYDHVRAQLDAAFDHVALSFSCTLPMLLEETRARGLNDDDIRHLLSLDELDFGTDASTDQHYHCARSNAGTPYITRDTAPVNEPISSFELFTEFWSSLE